MTGGAGSGAASAREKIFAALLYLVSEFGYRSLALEQVLLRADISRAAFERHFDSLGECFATLWTEIDAELEARMAAGFERGPDWQDRLRNALLAGLDYLAANEDRAILYFDEAVYWDGGLRERRQQALARLASMIDSGDGRSGAEGEAGDVAAAICGAIWHRVQVLVRSGRARDLPAELPQLMHFAVLPYRGAAAAESELRRGPPQ